MSWFVVAVAERDAFGRHARPPLFVHAAMAAPAVRLARVLTAAHACRVNAQLVHPARAQVGKPHELASALARPLHAAAYAPESPAAYLAATLAFGIINGERVTRRVRGCVAECVLCVQDIRSSTGTSAQVRSAVVSLARL